ncbi:MAG: hypothetical protein QM791_04485 [Ferruginibacter sp.]
MNIQAVITGDIVNSTRLTPAKEQRLVNQITGIFGDNKSEFYRGDSFQAYIKKPSEALKLALLCRAAAISLSKEAKEVPADVRLSIGIAAVTVPVKLLKTARGEAFVLSGRHFDEIVKREERLIITTANALANTGLMVISDYVNSIFALMTGKQAEVIYELLRGEKQKMVAKKLKKTKSTIHQRVTAGRWPEIEKLLKHYETIITQLS